MNEGSIYDAAGQPCTILSSPADKDDSWSVLVIAGQLFAAATSTEVPDAWNSISINHGKIEIADADGSIYDVTITKRAGERA